ncbi:MAG: amino acid ABC transporter permease [Promethearchaeota archaeon]
MLFQTELDFVGIGIAISIIIFPIGIFLLRWYAKKIYMAPTNVWDTSLKPAYIVSLILLLINVPISILINFLFAENLFFYLMIQYYNYILIDLFVGAIIVMRIYKKKFGESVQFVIVVQLILFGIVLILGYVISLILGYIYPDISDAIFFILEFGLFYTLFITAISLLIGFLIGILLALMRVYGSKELGWLSSGYEKIFRGIPLLVLILIFSAGMPGLFFYLDPLDRLLAGVILALGLRSGAYQSQIFRGAILSVNPGQMEAGRALGMSGLQAFQHIVMPQALRLAIPSWSNEYAVVIKDSSFAGYYGSIVEMTLAAYIWGLRTLELFTLSMGVVAFIYLLFTYPVTRVFGERQTKKLKKLGMGGG